MLTVEDIQMIRDTREEIMHNRKTTIQVQIKKVVGEDPYSGEKQYDESTEDVKVRWMESSQAIEQKGYDENMQDGEKKIDGEAFVTFPVDVDVYNVKKIFRNDKEYKLTNVDARGLGGVNRYECTVKAVK